MYKLKISSKSYAILLRARKPKQTDKVLKSGDVELTVDSAAFDKIRLLSMDRKPNRITASRVIFMLAKEQGYISDVEYKQTWGTV